MCPVATVGSLVISNLVAKSLSHTTHIYAAALEGPEQPSRIPHTTLTTMYVQDICIIL